MKPASRVFWLLLIVALIELANVTWYIFYLANETAIHPIQYIVAAFAFGAMVFCGYGAKKAYDG
jgi:RsiW-degrading membrane proteinase PrsW (M82 family)